ncbi:MAG: hypothetical protein ABIH52_01425 [Candidatus Aenigmatarchaeota archaeon]|nr:hypothetical protein [Nanoarchaeota archaeon]
MERNTKFVIGGLLLFISLFLKDWVISIMMVPPPGAGIAIFVPPLLMFVVLVIGLLLVADSIFE